MVIYIIIAIVLIGLFVLASESIIKRKSSLIEGVEKNMFNQNVQQSPHSPF
jgi:hypothetical protein